MKRKPPAISSGNSKMVLVRDAAQGDGAEAETYDLQAVAVAGCSPRRHASTSVNKSQAGIEPSGGNEAHPSQQLNMLKNSYYQFY